MVIWELEGRRETSSYTTVPKNYVSGSKWLLGFTSLARAYMLNSYICLPRTDQSSYTIDPKKQDEDEEHDPIKKPPVPSSSSQHCHHLGEEQRVMTIHAFSEWQSPSQPCMAIMYGVTKKKKKRLSWEGYSDEKAEETWGGKKASKERENKAGKHNLGVRPSELSLKSACSPPW